MIEGLRRDVHPYRVVEREHAPALLHPHLEREVEVRDHVVAEGHAPCGEQRVELGAARPGRLHEAARHARLLHLGVGVDEREEPAAAQHVLVDGVERFARQRLRMDQHQDVDVLGDLFEPRGQRAQLEELLHLLDDHPRRRIEAAERRLHPPRPLLAFDRQRAQQAHDLLRGLREVVHELGDVVLEELLALGGEEGDGFLVIDGVRTDEAEVEAPLVEPQRHAAQAVRDGAVLLFGEGLGVDHVQRQLPAGEPFVLVEQGAHAIGVAADARRPPQLALREVETQGHRLLQAREDAARAFGEGEQAVLGEVDARRSQEPARQDVHREQQYEGEHDSGGGRQTAGHAWSSLASHPALRHSITTALTNSQNTMSETK